MTGDGAVKPQASKRVEVAVAVIEGPNRQVLLAQRPSGKPMPGYWEFPGGKLEKDETVFAALAREIEEELGLVVEGADPWVHLPFVYPHAHVMLHFMRVFSWHGTPTGREGQAFRFESIDAFSTEPWLPGALPLKRWLRVPERYAISSARELGIDVFLRRFAARVTTFTEPLWLCLREPDLNAVEFERLFLALMPIARANGVTVLVSSRHAASYWHRADGVHLTAADLHQLKTRPPVRWCLASCHDAGDLVRAGAMGCDAAMLGSVMPTSSHPDRAPLGWSGFQEKISATAVPVFALGGLNLNAATLRLARSHGAHGVAAQRAAW